MPNEVWTEGWLPDGTHIRVERDPYTNRSMAGFHINWERVRVERVTRLRDGGTTTIETERGILFCYRGISHPAGHYDKWTPSGAPDAIVLSATAPGPGAGEVWVHENGGEVRVEDLETVVRYRSPDAHLPVRVPVEKFKQRFKKKPDG